MKLIEVATTLWQEPAFVELGRRGLGEARDDKILERFVATADSWVAELVWGAPAVDPADGCFPLPTAPGLGVHLDHDACARQPRANARFNLVRHGWERPDGAAAGNYPAKAAVGESGSAVSSAKPS